MKFIQLLETRNSWTQGRDISPWHHQSSAGADILMGSIARLSRSLAGHCFPGWSSLESRREILSILRPAVQAQRGYKTAFRVEMSDLDLHSRRLILERKLLSPCMAARQEGCEIIIPKKQNISIMLNEEEHLVIHRYSQDFECRNMQDQLMSFAANIEQKLPQGGFARNEQQGYLLSQPSECGDGMQFYVLLHLPAMVLSDMRVQIQRACGKIGLGIHAFYSDDDGDTGNIFVIYTQPAPLGKSQQSIASLERVIQTLINREAEVRRKLFILRPWAVRDQVGRALGLLSYANCLSYKEMADSISMIRLGISLNIISYDASEKAITPRLIELLTILAPAHLAEVTGSQGSPQLPCERAEQIKALLRELNIQLKP